jgi:hypothetical protein
MFHAICGANNQANEINGLRKYQAPDREVMLH